MLRSFGKRLVVVLACAASGCSASCCYDCIDESVSGCQDHLEAKFAWHQCKGCFCEVENYSDFRDGFIAGYIHVMNGGGCCRPTLPPRKYWSKCVSGPDTNCRVVAWYNGWDSGAAQAHRDGVGSGPLVTAADIYHTNNPYPVELPDDLKRTNTDELVDPPAVEMLPEDEEFVPGINGEGVELNGDPVPEAPYNPPANPVPDAAAKTTKVDGRIFLDDSLTPPAPPRVDGSGN